VPSLHPKAFQVAFEKTLGRSARLSAEDVALLEKKAKALKDPKEKSAAAEVLALVQHDRILDENEVEPARQALCKLLGVSPSRLPAPLERALARAVPVPNVRVADYDLAFDFSKDAPSFPAKAVITLEKPSASKRLILEIDPDRLTIDDVRGMGRLLVKYVGLPKIWLQNGEVLPLAGFLLSLVLAGLAVRYDREEEDVDGVASNR